MARGLIRALNPAALIGWLTSAGGKVEGKPWQPSRNLLAGIFVSCQLDGLINHRETTHRLRFEVDLGDFQAVGDTSGRR